MIGDGPHADAVKFYIPFTYGLAFAIQPQMISNATFFSNYSTPFTGTTDFYSTATLSSALVLGGTPGNPGSQNNEAGIIATSGFNYGPTGISSPVPEPGTWLLFTSGMGIMAFLKRRRN